MDTIYRSELNAKVAPAAKGEFRPLELGGLKVWPPVVLAPMAGVTNYPFRKQCRRFGAGLYVSEMITARPLVEGNRRTLELAEFGPDESPRSLQLYATDPHYTGQAVERLVKEGKVDHIDMNFGCPVRKVTRKGGGAAIPLKPRLLAAIVRAAVQAAGDIPVTIKFRMGINEEWMTYLDAGRVGQEEGCAAVALHARTAAQLYNGEARWDAIAELKASLDHIPVLGNGDIWEAEDALRMMRQTGCDAVVVGRGCLGRPWLFGDLAAVFGGREPANPPNLGEIAAIMLEHAQDLAQWFGEVPAMRDFRKHSSWYLKGFRGSATSRVRLMQVTSISELGEVLDGFDASEPFPPTAMRVPRGKHGRNQVVTLPSGYLDELDDARAPKPEAEVLTSGG